MQTIFTSLLSEILTIAEYAKDKPKFVENFEAFNKLEAILDVYDVLPNDVQTMIREHCTTSDEMLAYIPEDVFVEKYMQVSERELKKVLRILRPSLSPLQRQQISELLSSL